MEVTLLDVKRHIEEEHKQNTFTSYFKEIIYGGIDGIITTFAVAAGFSGAALSNEATTQLSFLIVLLFGLANLFADGVSMGLGNFLATRADQKLYCSMREQEGEELKENPKREAEETVVILKSRGFSEEDARALTAIYQKNEKYWLDFMMNHELEIPDPTDDNPLYTGFATMLSFLFFGFIPLIPFIVFQDFSPAMVFQFSAIGTFIALILLGILKWKIIGAGLLRNVGEVVIVGGIAALIAFFVGSLFTI